MLPVLVPRSLELASLGWFLLFVLLLAVLLAAQTLLLSAGSALAPAGASGVVVTCSDILFGYVGQIAVFGIMPDAMTLVGAMLLMVSVVMIMMDTVPPRLRDVAQREAEEPPTGELGKGPQPLPQKLSPSCWDPCSWLQLF